MRDAAFGSPDDQTQTEPDVTLHAIRSVLMQPETPVETAEADKSVDPGFARPDPQQPAARAAERPADEARRPAAATCETKDHAELSPFAAAIERLRDRVTSYRPTPKHVFWAVFALVAVLRPHWILLGVLITLFVIAGAFACFGAEAVWTKMTSLFQAYAKRQPARAARLSERLDRFALRWDTILDRFPEGSVDGLYLPDVRAIQARDEAHNDAVNARLATLQSENRT